MLSSSIELIPRLVLPALVHCQKVVGYMIVVARKHQKHGDNAGRHHHNTIGCNRIRIKQSILIGAHILLFFLGVSIESSKVYVTGGLVDPRFCPRGLKALVYDNSGEGEEKTVQTRRVFSKGPFAF